jgi:calmodulin
MANQVKNLDIEGDIKRAFAVFDKQGLGKIPTAELRHYLVSIGETLTEEEADAMMKAADPTGTGFIEYDHFLAMMTGN